MQQHLRGAGVLAALTLLCAPAAADAALTPSIEAGATATPDVGWIANVGVCDRWVSTKQASYLLTEQPSIPARGERT